MPRVDVLGFGKHESHSGGMYAVEECLLGYGHAELGGGEVLLWRLGGRCCCSLGGFVVGQVPRYAGVCHRLDSLIVNHGVFPIDEGPARGRKRARLLHSAKCASAPRGKRAPAGRCLPRDGLSQPAAQY